MSDSIYGLVIADPRWAHTWFPEKFFIHPDLVELGFTEDDFPITDLRVSMQRMELEGIDFPEEFRDPQSGELQIVISGQVPSIVESRYGFSCIKLGGRRYLLFCPKGTNGAGSDFGDDGTWHGPRKRDPDRDKANKDWFDWVSNPGG